MECSVEKGFGLRCNLLYPPGVIVSSPHLQFHILLAEYSNMVLTTFWKDQKLPIFTAFKIIKTH